jgi:hypothetical protein
MSFFPPSTNSDYAGARISVWYLGLVGILTLAPGLIHSFLPDGGAGVIAHLDMGDRREMVIGTFRWEGATQLAYGMILLAGAIRYQALAPFLLLTAIVERGLMALEGWVITPPSNGHHPPEHYASVVGVALTLVFLLLSLRRRRG